MLKRQQRIVATSIAVLWPMLASCAIGGELRIVGQNVVFDPHVESVAHFVVGFQNISGTTEGFYSWELAIEATPAAGATGDIGFHAYDVPEHYVLGGNSTGITRWISGAPPMTTRLYFDQAYKAPNPIVPLVGANLIDIAFTPSLDARGTFNIKAVPFSEGLPSFWESADHKQYDFENLPRDGGSVLIGTIEVVPEPSALALAMVAGVAALACCSWTSIRQPMHRAHLTAANTSATQMQTARHSC